MDPQLDPDDLLERLRIRASDPKRRTSTRPNRFTTEIGTMDIGGLVSMLRGVSADLDRVVAANRAGRVDAAGQVQAERIRTAMADTTPDALPAPTTPGALDAAEARLGVGLPAFLRRVYTEVANGGFGPGSGLLSADGIVAAHARLRRGDELPRGRSWPAALIPLVDGEPGFDCVDAVSGRVIAWDPEGLSERSGEARFQRSFGDIAPSVEAWLDAWARSRTREEVMAEAMHRSRIESARQARASIAKKTPEERAAMGLPAVGWERVVWGGIGLDEEDETPEG